MSLTTAENGDVTLSKARHHVCLEAAWELEAIALMLPELVPAACVEEMKTHFRVRCVAGRLRELANALMAGLCDDAVPVDGVSGLRRRVLLDQAED